MKIVKSSYKFDGKRSSINDVKIPKDKTNILENEDFLCQHVRVEFYMDNVSWYLFVPYCEVEPMLGGDRHYLDFIKGEDMNEKTLDTWKEYLNDSEKAFRYMIKCDPDINPSLLADRLLPGCLMHKVVVDVPLIVWQDIFDRYKAIYDKYPDKQLMDKFFDDFDDKMGGTMSFHDFIADMNGWY